MKNKALKTAGTIFLVISLVQLSRVIFRFHVYFEQYEIPVAANAVAFVIFAGLALWMFRSARE